MNDTINPHLLEPKFKRWQASRWERKTYLPILSGAGYTRATRKTFTRATDAQAYADKARSTWCRLYDEHIVAMSQVTDLLAADLMTPSPAER